MSEWSNEASFPVPAPADRVYRALVDEAALREWFAEFAEVDARVGGDYRFWGRFTVGTPGGEEEGGRLIEMEADRSLAYEWRFLGVPSVVTFTLTPSEQGESPTAEEHGASAGPRDDGAAASDDRDRIGAVTRVAIVHTLEGPIDRPRPEALVDDWWRLVLGNLTAYASGHGTVMRPDFADDRPEIRLSTLIEAPPSAVFRALIDPALLNQWIARDARVEPRIGGAFDLGWAAAEGVEHEGAAMEILEFEPDARLAITWPDWRGDSAVPTQRVSWTLVPEGRGTRVTLVHSGFVRAVDISDYPFGWGHFLEQMAQVVVASRSLDASGGKATR